MKPNETRRGEAKWRRAVVPALAAGLAVAIASCEKPEPSTIGGLGVGKIAPEIQASGWFNGPPPTTEEMKGRVVVLDAWASNCGPCAAIAPEMLRLYNKYHPRGVIFVGITYENGPDREQAEKFVRQHHLPWPNGYGAENTFKNLEVVGIPAVWVIGRDGRIVWNRDALAKESIEEAIDRALAARPADSKTPGAEEK